MTIHIGDLMVVEDAGRAVNYLRKHIEVRAQILSCTRCELSANCKSPVTFSGKAPSRIVVLGEAPGKEEDAKGKCFVGPAGQFLRRTMEEAGIDPLQMAYVNTVSCFPHGPPTQAHKKACRKNLIDQLNLLAPEYVLVLGAIAISSWWDVKITTMRSQWWRIPDDALNGRPWAMSTWHPSYALRSGGRRSHVGNQLFNDLVVFRSIAIDGDFDPESVVSTLPFKYDTHSDGGMEWQQGRLV